MYCPICRAPLYPGTHVCSHCGSRIGDDGMPAIPTDWTGKTYAGYWVRLGAALIDGLSFYAVFAAIAFLLGMLSVSVPALEASLISLPEGETLWGLLSLLLMVGYWTAFEGSGYQATPGKMVFGLRVTDTSGYHVPVWRVIARASVRTVQVFVFVYLGSLVIVFPDNTFAQTLFQWTVAPMIGFFIIGFSDRKQGPHDLVANTIVLQNRQRE